MISKTAEEYLKTMYVLYKQNGDIRVTDIADKMKCSKPNVTKQLNILKSNGLIKYETYGKIELTQSGLDYSKRILAACDIIYLLLNDVIGVSKEDALNESVKIKSVISDNTIKKISNYVYDELELGKMTCNFNMNNEKCRDCIIKKGINNDRVN